MEHSVTPKKMFLIDGLGALLSAFFLFIVLRTFDEYFGMPDKPLIYLSLIAMVFCTYSISCHLFLKENWKPFLKTISIANIFYCFLTISLVVYYYQNLTPLGLAYFVGEKVIVVALVVIEIKTSNKQMSFNG